MWCFFSDRAIATLCRSFRRRAAPSPSSRAPNMAPAGDKKLGRPLLCQRSCSRWWWWWLWFGRDIDMRDSVVAHARFATVCAGRTPGSQTPGVPATLNPRQPINCGPSRAEKWALTSSRSGERRQQNAAKIALLGSSGP